MLNQHTGVVIVSYRDTNVSPQSYCKMLLRGCKQKPGWEEKVGKDRHSRDTHTKKNQDKIGDTERA